MTTTLALNSTMTTPMKHNPVVTVSSSPSLSLGQSFPRRLRVSCVATNPRKTSEQTHKKTFRPIKEVPNQITHTITQEKLEIFKSMENWAQENLLSYLKPVETSWQPQDLLPQTNDEDRFYEQVKELRDRTREIPDDYFVVLVGDMITEEALPTYQTTLNTLDGVKDETGGSLTPWAVWVRAWTAEGNRHGDLLNKYLYLSGRVDMQHVERTIQYLIGSGMDSKFENNPYNGFIYTSFQERATFISHANTAKLATTYGDTTLAKICGTIAADEKRHETAYTRIVEKLFEIDPDGTVQALASMMRKRITMPAHLMHDGRDDNLFDHYGAVAQRIGVYTAMDYAGILEFLLRRWKVESLGVGFTGEGRRAQEYLCSLPQKITRLEERANDRVKLGSRPSVAFSWIYGREVGL
ncbi:unnamed protein product [Brassica oleracea]